MLCLLKALYSLKQAELAWWHTLSKFMEELGFKQFKTDAGIYILYDDGDRIIVLIYVNDAIFTGKDKAKVLKAKAQLMKCWECHNLGNVKEFLCM